MHRPDPPSASRFALLLGRDPATRRNLFTMLVSAGTYVAYSLITVGLVVAGLADARAAIALIVAMLAVNVVFYGVVRAGWANAGPDPGLARVQLATGIAFMYAGYAIQGPSAPAVTVVMASHIVYAMFWMPPRRVWQWVSGSLLGLAATMAACHAAWPDRYPAAVQFFTFCYAALVVPTIAMLAHRVAGMTQRLRSQRAELETVLDRVRILATRDALTQTHSRAHMSELAAAQLERHRDSGAPLSLALLDVDHFKGVNDRYGHAVGDEVLRHFAERTQAVLRSGDLLARWGGEEFLVLLPEAEPTQAMAALERLQADLAAAGAAAMPHGLQVSFSAGVTQLRAGETFHAALERADHAMYRAKREGRARSVAA